MRRIALFLAFPLLLTVAAPLQAASASSTVALPSVKGAFGVTPTINFPTSAAPKSLQVVALHSGTGATVQKADLLVTNYVGQIWRGKVFDSSFSRHMPAAFPIGVGQVLSGWDKGLVGQHIGSRVLLVVPPSDGYGATGDTAAGITGTDTLVFVVDLIGRYTKSAGADANSHVVGTSFGSVKVTGSLSSAPTLKVASGAKAPTKLTTVVIARGSGAKVRAGLLVLQLVVVNWSTNAILQSTWKSGYPFGLTVGNKASPSILDSLIGLPIGSRVLVEIPKVQGNGPYAIGVDIAAQASS